MKRLIFHTIIGILFPLFVSLEAAESTIEEKWNKYIVKTSERSLSTNVALDQLRDIQKNLEAAPKIDILKLGGIKPILDDLP